MKTVAFAAGVLGIAMASSLAAFQIDLPKHYRENLEGKRLKEAAVLWHELARSEVEVAIRKFVIQNPQIDGLDLQSLASDLSWFKDGRVITVGRWHAFLAEWELAYPALSPIRWAGSKLVLSAAYDWKSKTLRQDGDGEIRLVFKITRRGAAFSKKTIHAEFESSDYGEVYLMLPFGGVELRRANQPLQHNAGSRPPSGDSSVSETPSSLGPRG